MNLFDFEKKYKVILTNIEEWAYLRIKFAKVLIKEKNSSKKKLSKNKKFKLKYFFYGFRNWFRNYDGFVFTDSLERRKIKKIYIDKISDDIINRLNNKKILMVELPNQIHYPIDNIVTKYIVSEKFIKILIYIVKKFSISKSKDISELNNILKIEKINFEYHKEINNFDITYKVYKMIFKFYKLKFIIINCHYCRFPVIKAANDLNIKIIEVQHGVINKAHYAYISELKLNVQYFPNILLSFGENEKKLPNKIIKNVIPIGSFYLEYLLDNFKLNSDLLNFINQYKCVVGVSLQDQKWEYDSMFEFIITCAKLNQDILYIMIPRKKEIFNYKLPENVIVYKNLDCYNIILHCKVHTTIYSSCALEAPTLGIPNILVDIKGYATKYYKNILSNEHTKIVNNKDDFLNAIDILSQLDKEFIQLNNKNIFINDYDKNITNFIKGLN